MRCNAFEMIAILLIFRPLCGGFTGVVAFPDWDLKQSSKSKIKGRI